MKIMRIRRVGRELTISVLRKLAERSSAEYVSVSMDEAGRIIYNPVCEGRKTVGNDVAARLINTGGFARGSEGDYNHAL